jgi:hypothetical protein
MCLSGHSGRDGRYSDWGENRRQYGHHPDAESADDRIMNETLLRTTELAAQYDDDDVLDAWLANLSPDELDRFLIGMANHDNMATSALDMPA